MNKEIKPVETRKLAHIVKIGYMSYYVDTVEITTKFCANQTFETMAFECDANGKVTDWHEKFVKYTHSPEEAKEMHNNVCQNLKYFLKEARDNEKSSYIN